MFQQQIGTVLPPLTPHLITETLRSLITAPSLLCSLIHVLIRRLIPHITHAGRQRTTVNMRQSLRQAGRIGAQNVTAVLVLNSLPAYGQKKREGIQKLGETNEVIHPKVRRRAGKNREWLKSRSQGK